MQGQLFASAALKYLFRIREAVKRQATSFLLADQGYDAEHNRILCREEVNVSKAIIAVKRNTIGRKWLSACLHITACLSRMCKTTPRSPKFVRADGQMNISQGKHIS